MNKYNLIRGLFVMGGFLYQLLFGRYGNELFALILLMGIDYITGVMCAFKTKTLSSYVGFEGIFKKVCMLMLVAVGGVVDMIIGSEVAALGVMFFYIGNEGLSVLENAVNLGIKAPDFVSDSLEQIMSDKRKE